MTAAITDTMDNDDDNQEQNDPNTAPISPFTPPNASPETEKKSNTNYTININKNKHNYDRFNALIETLNDDNMDTNNITPHLTRAISDHRHNKKPKQLKRKHKLHNSDPINCTTQQMHIYNETSAHSKSDYKTHEITFEDSDCKFVVVDQYSELTPVPMDSPINDIDTETNHRLEAQYGAKSNMVYSNVRISPLPKPLANHRSAPANAKHHFDFDNEYEYDDEKHLHIQIQNMSKPRLNPFKISNSRSIISTIETIKKKFKWENKNENHNLIDEKEDIMSNIDILMTTSFHILTTDGFYSTKDLRVVHDKNRKSINNRGPHTPISQQINRENGSFL
eukprot:774382_1